MERAAPETQGLSAERLARIGTVMGQYVEEGKLPGVATLIARRGKVVHLETVGWADVERRQPLAEDTVYRIYSMTKPVTVVAALMLWEEGRFLLDDPIGDFIPELRGMPVLRGTENGVPLLSPAASPVTVRQLMTHASGMAYGSVGSDSPGERMYAEANLGRPDRTLAQAMQVLGGLPLLFDPGTRMLYSVSIDVLGRLIEVVSGTPLDRFLRERVLGPLGMADSGFRTPPGAADRLAALYGRGEKGRLAPIGAPCGRDFTRGDPLHSGGAGMVSSILDYARFALMLASGGELHGTRLLSPRTVALMGSRHLRPEVVWHGDPLVPAGVDVGLGTWVLRDPGLAGELAASRTVGHGGLAHTEFWVDSANEMVGIVMTQYIAPLTESGLPVRLQFRNLAYQALVG